MNALRMKRPSPAFVVAMVALFVALGGTAGAVVNAAVPLAKRALVADNAKKVGGLTAVQLGSAAAQAGAKAALSASPAGPRPASTAAGLTVIKSQPLGSLPPDAVNGTQVTCDAGQTAIGGGISSDTHLVAVFDSYASSSTTWSVGAGNFGGGTANVTAYAICLK
ncbi:MAG: hypothetical protein ACRDPV_14750 [Gaiellaceae bacterium]